MAGSLDREEALLRPHPAAAAACAAGLRVASVGRAAAIAAVAADRHIHGHVTLHAGKRLFQRHVQIIAKIVSGAVGLAAPRPAREFGEHLVENVGKAAAAKATAKAAKTTRASTGILEGGMAHPVIGGAFLGVFQDFIGFGGLAKPLGGRLVIRIAVRMILHRKLAIGRFQVLLVGVPRDAKDFVVITLAHAVQARNAGCGGQAGSSPKSCPAIQDCYFLSPSAESSTSSNSASTTVSSPSAPGAAPSGPAACSA